MLPTKLCAIATVVFFAVSCHSASASPIGYSFTGVVTQTESSPISVGSLITGFFLYDSASVASVETTSDAGGDKSIYRWIINGLNFGLGITHESHTVLANGIGVIEIQNNPTGADGRDDAFSLRTESSNARIDIQFQDESAAIFPNTDLPTNLSLTDFTFPNKTTFGYSDTTFDVDAIGMGLGRQFSGTVIEIQALPAPVPLPSPIFIMGIAIFGLAACKRSHKKT